MYTTKYFDPWNDASGKGFTRSECTNYNIDVVVFSLWDGNLSLCCFPIKHHKYTSTISFICALEEILYYVTIQFATVCD
jgi:hypothetical protein